MTTPAARQTSARLEVVFGLGRRWTSPAGASAMVWETPASDVLGRMGQRAKRSSASSGRRGRDAQAYPVALLAASDDESTVCVAGPQAARPVRQLPAGRIIDLMKASRSLEANIGTDGE